MKTDQKNNKPKEFIHFLWKLIKLLCVSIKQDNKYQGKCVNI